MFGVPADQMPAATRMTAREPENSEIVRFRAAAGEDQLVRLTCQQSSEPIARVIDRGAGFATGSVNARGIPKMPLEIRLHRFPRRLRKAAWSRCNRGRSYARNDCAFSLRRAVVSGRPAIASLRSKRVNPAARCAVRKTLPPIVVPRADHGFAAEHCRVRIDRDMSSTVGCRFPPLRILPCSSFWKLARSQRDPVIQLHVRTDLARLANDHAGSVIDEKMRPDFCAGMNVDSRPAVGPFRHHARDERHVFLI